MASNEGNGPGRATSGQQGLEHVSSPPGVFIFYFLTFYYLFFILFLLQLYVGGSTRDDVACWALDPNDGCKPSFGSLVSNLPRQRVDVCRITTPHHHTTVLDDDEGATTTTTTRASTRLPRHSLPHHVDVWGPRSVSGPWYVFFSYVYLFYILINIYLVMSIIRARTTVVYRRSGPWYVNFLFFSWLIFSFLKLIIIIILKLQLDLNNKSLVCLLSILFFISLVIFYFI